MSYEDKNKKHRRMLPDHDYEDDQDDRAYDNSSHNESPVKKKTWDPIFKDNIIEREDGTIEA